MRRCLRLANAHMAISPYFALANICVYIIFINYIKIIILHIHIYIYMDKINNDKKNLDKDKDKKNNKVWDDSEVQLLKKWGYQQLVKTV